MVNGLYTASRGMANIMSKQDINSQNLANTNTTGFKMARMTNQAEIFVGRNDQGQLTQREYQSVSDVTTSFTQGPMIRTGNDFDLALNGKGFFTVETSGGTRYTRNGGLALNSLGELVTLSGNRLMDDSGAPIILKGEKVKFQEDGKVYVDGIQKATLAIVDFDNTKPLRYGADGLFLNSDEVGNPSHPPEEIGVRQGFLEGSNVDPISTMVSLMAEFRNYEADQKALKAIDETLGRAVNEVGKV